jgi:uncharacterized repeat protein (TIGR03803 family)
MSSVIQRVLCVLAPGAFAIACCSAAQGWTLKTLHSFCAESQCADGSQPVAGLVRDAAGNLYGTTETGGDNDGGVVFELSPTGDEWSYQVLHAFCSACGEGTGPITSLILDVNGSLYGTTVEGGAHPGCGTAFRLSPNARRTKWKKTLLHVFSCKPFGDQATSALTYQGKQTGALYDGVSPLYGTTDSGGAGAGTVYQLTPDGANWKHETIYAFCPHGTDGCTDGRAPGSDLIFDSSGMLYGMTGVGGSTGNGVVYQLKPSADGRKWREKILYNFCQLDNCTDGALPAGALVMNGTGRLFGTSNGPPDAGNIFELVPKGEGWSEKTLHIFNTGNCDGYNPAAGLLLDPSGSFYGTTSIGGCSKEFGGTVFSLTGKKYTPIYTFCSLDHCADGDASVAPVIEDPSGNLYGTTVLFGANGNGGTVFELRPER